MIGQDRIVCAYCMRVFYNESDFRHHRKVIHNIESDEEIDEKNIPDHIDR